MKEYDEAIEIAPNTYWVGFYDETANFHCNPYLIVVNGEGILIDPGSIPHFPVVARKVASVIKPNKIKYIVIHHQDPDLASNITVFERLIGNPELRVITTERVSFLTNYYGFKTPYRFVEEGGLKLGDVELEFMRTPYLHAPGAFVTYDKSNQTLFSSDLFGGFSDGWDLYAKDNYPSIMEKFHHRYMPPGDILKNQVIEFEKLNLNLIASQHGSVIQKEFIKQNMDALKSLKTGGYLIS